MNLDNAQRRTVSDWIGQGQKLSEIQKRLADELGVHPTYMEVRLLVDDLKLMPKDAEPSKPVELRGRQPAASPTAPLEELEPNEGGGEIPPEGDLPQPGGGGVSVKGGTVSRPGALVRGNGAFSDGNSAAWDLGE